MRKVIPIAVVLLFIAAGLGIFGWLSSRRSEPTVAELKRPRVVPSEEPVVARHRVADAPDPAEVAAPKKGRTSRERRVSASTGKRPSTARTGTRAKGYRKPRIARHLARPAATRPEDRASASAARTRASADARADGAKQDWFRIPGTGVGVWPKPEERTDRR